MKNSEFVTGSVPITKEEVRALVLNKLNLKNKKYFVDVGSGTGTVSIEAALSYEKLKVIAIECKKEALALTKENMQRFQVNNMKVLSGYAPLPLEQAVDAMFIGGTGGNLKEIIKWAYESLVEGGKVIANFIILDTFYEAMHLMKEQGFKEVEVTQVSVSKLALLGKGEYFRPENPVFIVEGVK